MATIRFRYNDRTWRSSSNERGLLFLLACSEIELFIMSCQIKISCCDRNFDSWYWIVLRVFTEWVLKLKPGMARTRWDSCCCCFFGRVLRAWWRELAPRMKNMYETINQVSEITRNKLIKYFYLLGLSQQVESEIMIMTLQVRCLPSAFVSVKLFLRTMPGYLQYSSLMAWIVVINLVPCRSPCRGMTHTRGMWTKGNERKHKTLIMTTISVDRQQENNKRYMKKF